MSFSISLVEQTTYRASGVKLLPLRPRKRPRRPVSAEHSMRMSDGYGGRACGQPQTSHRPNSNSGLGSGGPFLRARVTPAARAIEAQVAGRRRIDREACRRDRRGRAGGAGERRGWPRRRGGESGLLLEGGYSVGQVVERLPRVARRVQAGPAHQYVRQPIAHQKT